MTKRKYNVVNVGAHVNPPPTMWQEYFPEHLRDRAPKLIKKEFPGEGEYEVLVLEGVEHRMLGVQLGLQEKKVEEDEVSELYPYSTKYPFAHSFLEGPAGNRDPAARIADQDRDNVDADVMVHPGFPIMRPKDMDTQFGLMWAFNDWMADFCAYDPSRLIGIGEIPLWDIDLAVKEAHRIAKRGLKGVLMPAVPGYVGAWSCPAHGPYTDPKYRPLWQALSDLDLKMVVHADAAAATPGLEDYTNAAVNMILNKTLPSEMIASLIIGNVFRDFPNLKLVCVETGVGWMAHLVRWMDVIVREQPTVYGNLIEPPSETFHRHVFGSFLWDTVGILNRDIIGIDNIMWCNDYPHSYGPWPHSHAQIKKELEGLTEEERYKILAGNAVKVFGLKE